MFGLGKEKAKVIDWEVKWSGGSPCPSVYSNGHKTFLTYLAREPQTLDDFNNGESFGVVEFLRCHSFRFGIVNDEAANGHPLYEHGLKIYQAHEIINSKWIAELKDIHRVHPGFKESFWSKRKHYLLFFHDEIFECIAEDYRVESISALPQDLNRMIAERLNFY